MTRRAGHPDGVFRAVADFTYDWESWVDPAGRLAWVNPAVERVTGYPVEACLRMRNYPLRLVHRDDRARIALALEGARGGSSANDVELRILHKDGSIRWVAMSWQPMVLGGRSLGYRTSARQIDLRKRDEDELREAKARAEEADRAKSEFLAVMSHEIRSPMQAIAGYAQLLGLTELDATQRGYLDVILRQNAALLRIVDDILDFSALQGDKLPIHEAPFDYREVVDEVVEAVRPRAHGLALKVRVDPRLPRAVLGDAYRVRQVLRNLVDNAVKFTREGGVTVEASREGDRLVTAVVDTGVGVRDAGALFQMFHQADASTSRRHGGSGLGLAISKRLCERMGGDLTVESRPGRGSRFAFYVPLREARASVPPPPPPPVDGMLAARVPLDILVVDDSAVARDVAARLLAALGYRADVAASGRAAVRRARAKRYDVALLDMQMPGLDGAATARELRALYPLHIVALTANVFVRPGDGVDAVLTKPVELGALAGLLEAQAHDPRVLDDLRQTLGQAGARRVVARVEREAESLLAGLPATAHALKGLLLTLGCRAAARLAERVAQGGAADDLPARVRDAIAAAYARA